MVLPQPTHPTSELTQELLDQFGTKLRLAVADWQSRLSGTPDIEDLSQAVAHRALEEAYAALDRIDDGTYGLCQGCSRPIAVERLDALPHTPMCTTCADRSHRR